MPSTRHAAEGIATSAPRRPPRIMRWARIPMCIAALTACLGVQPLAAAPATTYKIVTASQRGTYIQIGRDLARFVAPDARIELEALPSKGSAENVRRLRYDEGVKLAIVQSDVYQAFLDHANAGSAEAAELIGRLRVVLPLYNEEIYFVVRADSPLQFVHEIKDQRINIGPLQSGTAMSASTLYRLMFGEPLRERMVQTQGNEDALLKLTGDKSVDVVAIVAGQPAKLLAEMKPEAKKIVRLLKIDLNSPATKAALQTYVAASVRSASYPNWLEKDVDGLAVKSYLVTYDFSYPKTQSDLASFGRSLCKNFTILQSEGHPKWREVDLTMPRLGQGWRYYRPTERVLRDCQPRAAAAPRPAAPASSAPCSQQERILGLCRGP